MKFNACLGNRPVPRLPYILVVVPKPIISNIFNEEDVKKQNVVLCRNKKGVVKNKQKRGSQKQTKKFSAQTLMCKLNF